MLVSAFSKKDIIMKAYDEAIKEDEKGIFHIDLKSAVLKQLKERNMVDIFFENVKNLVGHDNGNTFRVICEQLDILGYKYTYQVLNAMNYGNVAQNRERIYIVASYFYMFSIIAFT